jgi:hypothetical protein
VGVCLASSLRYLERAGRFSIWRPGVFTRADLIRLAARLLEIAGKFLPFESEPRECSAHFRHVIDRQQVATPYTVSGCKGIDVAEIVVDRVVTGCGATGARSVIAVMKHCTS